MNKYYSMDGHKYRVHNSSVEYLNFIGDYCVSHNFLTEKELLEAGAVEIVDERKTNESQRTN